MGNEKNGVRTEREREILPELPSPMANVAPLGDLPVKFISVQWRPCQTCLACLGKCRTDCLSCERLTTLEATIAVYQSPGYSACNLCNQPNIQFEGSCASSQRHSML